MKINIKTHKSQINISDKIEKIEFNSPSEDLFEEIQHYINEINIKDKLEISRLVSEIKMLPNGETKKSKIEGIKRILIDKGIPIAQSISASIVFEVLKRIV